MSAQDSTLDDRPRFTWEEALAAASRFGDFEHVKTLPSERDLNFLIRPKDALADDQASWVVLKIHNPNDKRAFVECQSQALERAASNGASCQRQLQTKDTKELIVSLPVTGKTGDEAVSECLCRALSFLPGRMLADAASDKACNQPELFSAIGKAVGSVTSALLDFKHESAHYDFSWNLQCCESVITSHFDDVAESRRPLLQKVFDHQCKELKPLLSQLRCSVVHNDPNDYNLVVSADGAVGVLDFGDMCHSYTVADAAICMAYLLFHCSESSPLVESVIPFVKSYHQHCSLQKAESEALFALAVMRVCTSVVMSSYQSRLEPDNEYLLISAKPAWRLLERLDEEGLSLDRQAVMRTACGF
eukprot:TRINITY_DN9881_c0_g1_i1.p1 TRINITY_DN9881_c0_g1~~TRINITY_DN9881_c0_g1_i1.p1  ORF type:complete len:361 (+),score=47.57 TRINITY_DN9881_c0_g1_i1:131-1213(+)